MDLSKYAKAAVAASGAVLVVLVALLQAGNVLPDAVVPYAQVLVSILTAVGVYAKRNNPAGQPGQDGEGL